jgi:iron(III) transport system permease protein
MTAADRSERPGLLSRLGMPAPGTLLLILVIGLLVVPPLWFLVQGSFFVNKLDGSLGPFTGRYYARLMDDARLIGSAVNSGIFAVGSAIVALLFGGFLAWLVERTNAPFKPLAYLTTIISLGTPYVLYVSAWLFLLGRAGPLNATYRNLTGNTDLLFNVYSLGGMVMIEGFLWSPLVFLLLSATFRAANPELEEAARMSGAGVWQTFRRVTFKMAMPALLALAMLVFIRAIESFEVPALVGIPGRVHVLTTDIFLEIRGRVPPDLGYASAFASVLLIVVGVLLYFYGRVSKNAERYHTVTGKGFRPRAFDLGKGRPLAGAIILVNFLLVLGLPTLVLVWASLLPFYQTFSVKALSLDNYRNVFASGLYFGLVWNTVLVASAAATITMALTLLAGWIAARRRPGGTVLDQLASAPLIFPGIVLGVAIMQVALALPFKIYGTVWILIIAFVVRYLPYGMRYSYTGVLQIHNELEEAASVAGATPVTTLRRVIAPLLAPAIFSGWLFIFLLATRVLSLPILLAGPNSQTMAVAMFDMWSNGQGTELAALGLSWTALMTVIAFVFYVLSRRSASDAYSQ